MNTRRDTHTESIMHEPKLKLTAGPIRLNGSMEIPRGAESLVLFVHGRDYYSYHRFGNHYLAKLLNKVGIATLIVDLLTPEEIKINQRARQLRFDSRLLAYRLVGVTEWLRETSFVQGLDIDYLGTGLGSAAALIAASECSINAIVSVEGRPDLAGMALDYIHTPTLLIVGEKNPRLRSINREALTHILSAKKSIRLVSGASNLLAESGSLEQAANIAGQWFQSYKSPTLIA